jgi:hypothetical protein
MYSVEGDLVTCKFKHELVLVKDLPRIVRSAGFEETMAAAKAIVRSSGNFR